MMYIYAYVCGILRLKLFRNIFWEHSIMIACRACKPQTWADIRYLKWATHIWKWYLCEYVYIFNNCKKMINDVVGIHVEILCVCTSNYNIWCVCPLTMKNQPFCTTNSFILRSDNTIIIILLLIFINLKFFVYFYTLSASIISVLDTRYRFCKNIFYRLSSLLCVTMPQ